MAFSDRWESAYLDFGSSYSPHHRHWDWCSLHRENPPGSALWKPWFFWFFQIHSTPRTTWKSVLQPEIETPFAGSQCIVVRGVSLWFNAGKNNTTWMHKQGTCERKINLQLVVNPIHQSISFRFQVSKAPRIWVSKLLRLVVKPLESTHWHLALQVQEIGIERSQGPPATWKGCTTSKRLLCWVPIAPWLVRFSRVAKRQHKSCPRSQKCKCGKTMMES